MSRLIVVSILLVGCSSISEPQSRPETVDSPAAAVSSRDTRTGFKIDLWGEIWDDPSLAVFRRALGSAQARWEGILQPSDPWDVESGRIYCFWNDEEWNWIPGGTIDDLAIIVRIDSLDGPLAQAGPCVVRYRGFLPPWDSPPTDFFPVLGMMSFDSTHVANSTEAELEDTILHEMGHVLGIGTYGWSTMGLLQNPADRYSAVYQDTYFSGWRAVEAFNDAGGRTYNGPKVPVESEAWSAGSRNGHWRESVMQTELMTPYAGSGRDPISRITLMSLADLGYSVALAQADRYTLPAGSPDMDLGEATPYGEDMLDGPIMVVDKDGSIVGRLPGPVRY